MTPHDWTEIVGFDDEPDYLSDPPDLPAAEAEALSLANWHLREIDTIRRRRSELVEHFEAEKRRLQMRLDARLEVLDSQEQWHSTPVLNLHRALLSADEKRKTITLACGTLRATKQQPEWKYIPPGIGSVLAEDQDEDTSAFVEWAMEHRPDLIGPRVVGIKVAQTQLTPLIEALSTLDAVPADALVITPAAPEKNAVKKALVKKSEDGKKVVALGVVPETMERPPGLLVREREPKFVIDTDTDDVVDAEIVDDAAG